MEEFHFVVNQLQSSANSLALLKEHAQTVLKFVLRIHWGVLDLLNAVIERG